MSSSVSAFLGYGYVINKYEDCPMPSYLENYDLNLEWEKWADKFVESEFYYPIETDDNKICFYGIKLTDTIDSGEYIELGNDVPHFDKECISEWNNFMTEFERFFPNKLNKKPQYILANTFWF